MPRICGAHHIFGIEHLLGQLWYREGAVLLRATGCKRCEANHEEVQTWEWNEIHSELTKISVQLTREAQASCYTAHGCTDEVIQITICRGGELQCSEANVIKCLIVKKHALICIFHQLMEGEHCIIRLHDSI